MNKQAKNLKARMKRAIDGFYNDEKSLTSDRNSTGNREARVYWTPSQGTYRVQKDQWVNKHNTYVTKKDVTCNTVDEVLKEVGEWVSK